MRNAGTIMCTAAHVKVSRDGELTIKQIDVAFDCGSIANADAVRAQIEGGTIFGMTEAVNEQQTIHDDAIVEQNFDHCPMLHISDVPRTINVNFYGLSGHQRMDSI